MPAAIGLISVLTGLVILRYSEGSLAAAGDEEILRITSG
jgi:hypothetical protein